MCTQANPLEAQNERKGQVAGYYKPQSGVMQFQRGEPKMALWFPDTTTMLLCVQ